MRPVMRWAGSKRQLLPTLRQYWSSGFRRYIEPFCGSACLFFDLEPQDAILGDLNGELVHTLRMLQIDVGRVISAIELIDRGPRDYYKIRALNPLTLTEADRAARFLYLNFYCFNGLYRTNRDGTFNVPCGRSKNKKKIDVDALLDASERLAKAMLIEADFEYTIQYAEKGDFVYLDPPYFVEKRRVFREYSGREFGKTDLGRLASSLYELDKRGVTFVLSYLYERELIETFSRWRIARVRTRRNIAGFASSRRGSYEVLISNLKG